MKHGLIFFLVLMIFLTTLPWGCNKKKTRAPDLSPAR
jgi:hypothetical protein